MTLKPENSKNGALDRLKWSLAFVLLLAGLLGNHYYSEVSMLVRSFVWLVLLAMAMFVASTTTKGGKVLDFFRDAQMELRKVVWPTRDETMQMTLVVGAMVIVLALFLWGMDGILVWLIGWLTGQRG